MLRPPQLSRRRGNFAVRGIGGVGGFILVLIFIGLRVMARSNRHDRETAGHSANKKSISETLADESLDRAAQAFEQGRFHDAVSFANSTIATSPNNFDAYVIRSASHRRLGNLQASLADATKACSLRGSDSEMPTFRASILMEMKRFPEAEDDFTRTINMSAVNVTAWLGRAEARIAQGKFDPAAEDMKKVFALAPPGWEDLDYAKDVQKQLEAAKAAGNAEAPPGK